MTRENRDICETRSRIKLKNFTLPNKSRLLSHGAMRYYLSYYRYNFYWLSDQRRSRQAVTCRRCISPPCPASLAIKWVEFIIFIRMDPRRLATGHRGSLAEGRYKLDMVATSFNY